MQPKWSTPERRKHLITLFVRSGGFCVFGEKNCTVPEHHYINFIDRLIADWRADDRARDSELWRAERRAMHSLGERRFPVRGQFSAISKDIFFANQPQFYIEAVGVSGVTLQPFAKVKVSSTYTHLYIDIAECLRTVSKNKRRKTLRYGKIPDSVVKSVRVAVQHYLDN
jgi:hypothetical protein